MKKIRTYKVGKRTTKNYNEWIKYIHDYQLNKNTEMEKKKMKMSDVLKIYPMQLEWYNCFVDYIQEQDPNLYNKACEYADYEEKQNLIIKNEIK